MIASLLDWIGTFFGRLLNSLIEFLSTIFGFVFGKLFDLLKLLFKPIFILIAIVFYLLYKVAELVLLLLQLLLGIGKVFFALVKGIFLTLAGFTFTPTARNDGQWTPIFTNIVDGLQFYQLDIVAYILQFGLWFGFGFAAIQIISSMRAE